MDWPLIKCHVLKADSQYSTTSGVKNFLCAHSRLLIRLLMETISVVAFRNIYYVLLIRLAALSVSQMTETTNDQTPFRP